MRFVLCVGGVAAGQTIRQDRDEDTFRARERVTRPKLLSVGNLRRLESETVREEVYRVHVFQMENERRYFGAPQNWTTWMVLDTLAQSYATGGSPRRE